MGAAGGGMAESPDGWVRSMSWSSSGAIGTNWQRNVTASVHGLSAGSALAGAATNIAVASAPTATIVAFLITDIGRPYKSATALTTPVEAVAALLSDLIAHEGHDGCRHLAVHGLVEHVVARTGKLRKTQCRQLFGPRANRTNRSDRIGGAGSSKWRRTRAIRVTVTRRKKTTCWQCGRYQGHRRSQRCS
jgi:hypothetical protein